MNKEEIKGKIKEIIANYDGSDVSEINEQTKFADDLGLDSLDLVLLVERHNQK